MVVSKQDSRPPGRKRYPGARPFSDSPEDRQIFFGRKADIDRLFERVLGAHLLVLFGKSGLGKTSLLMAGVFPRLRKKPFLPVPIRLNRPGSPAEIVLAAVTDACKCAGVDLTAGESGGVWEFLRASLIWKGDLLLTPVLVFDQFEEIFTLRDAGFRIALAAELGALVSGIPPERLRASERRGAERGARLGERPPEVKILLSLREEYLGTLQELSGAIPGLFQERVRLAPLDEDDARLAICSPAARPEEPGDAPFETPPFEYEEDALKEMLAFLRGESQIIEPFQLQLLCCRAEEIVAARAREANATGGAAQRAEWPAGPATAEAGQRPSPIHITRADLGGPAGMEAVLGQFYRHVIGMLGWRDRRRARRLCEEGLLSATGSRLMLDQTQIQSDYGMRAAALATLVDERLLRCEQRLESLFYEISHDRLAESIEQNRTFRIPRKLRHTLRGAAAVALLTVIALFWWNRQIEQARVAADRARSDAEELVAFLIGESFLEQLRPVGRNAILEEVQGKVQAYLDKAPDQDHLGQLRTRGLALRNAGDILMSRGKLGEAIAKFRDAAEVFERWAAKEPANPDPKAERARTLDRLGDALLDQAKITEALKTHREALALRQTLYDGRDHGVETTIDLADSNSAVGRMLNEMGKPQQALVHLYRARDLLKEPGPSALRSPRVLKARHGAIDIRAESLALMGDELGTRDAFTDARKITQEWGQNYPLSADARVSQVIAVSRLANEQMDRGAVEEALEQYGQINRAVDELIRWDDTNALWRRDFAATLILMAEGRSAVQQDQEALDVYDTALKLLEDLAKTDRSNMSLKKDLSWLYQSRGRLALVREEWKQAIEDFNSSERYIAEAAGADQAFAVWQQKWAWVLFDLAHARSGAGELAEATVLLRRGRAMISALIKAAPETTVLQQDLVIFFNDEVRALEESGQRAEASALAREKEQAVTRALAAQPSSTRLLNEVHLDHFHVGDKAKSAGRLDDALAAYREGLTKISRAVELEPDNVHWWAKLRNAHKRVGDALYEGKRWADAEVAYRNGIGSGEKAFAIALHRAELANAVFLLQLAIGDTLKAGGQQEAALTEFEHAREWIDKAIATAPSKSVYVGNLGILYLHIGKTKQASGDAAGAEAAFHTSLEAAERSTSLAAAQEEAPQQAERANSLHDVHEAFAEFLESRSDAAGALAAHGRALVALKRAAELDAKDPVYPDAMRLVYKQTARLKENSGDGAGTEADLRAAAEAGQHAAALGNSAYYLNRSGMGLFDLGNFYKRAGSPDKVLLAYGGAARQVELAIGLDANSALYHQNLSIARKMIGELREQSDDTANARVDYDAAVRAGRRATELASDNGAAWQALYLAQWFLGVNIERQGDTTEALRQLRDALKSAEQSARLLPQDHTVRGCLETKPL